MYIVDFQRSPVCHYTYCKDLANFLPRTSRMFLSQSCNSFSVLSIFKRQAKQIILSPAISYRRVQKESDERLCTVWSLVTVRNQLPVASDWKFQEICKNASLRAVCRESFYFYSIGQPLRPISIHTGSHSLRERERTRRAETLARPRVCELWKVAPARAKHRG